MNLDFSIEQMEKKNFYQTKSHPLMLKARSSKAATTAPNIMRKTETRTDMEVLVWRM